MKLTYLYIAGFYLLGIRDVTKRCVTVVAMETIDVSKWLVICV
jgi:hypothetical protein